MISLEDMKLSLRISNTALDSDISDTMSAAVLDLMRVGVNVDAVDNELIDMLIKLFVKWHLNYMDKGEQYHKNYMELVQSMTLSGGYNGAE